MYLQLRDALAERVATGEWKPGGAVPNESDLAREFGVSAGTMRKALDLMESERLLTRKQGRGTFVNDQSANDLALRFCNIRARDGQRVAGEFRTEHVGEHQANDAECVRLSLEKHDRVYRVRRSRINQGRAFLVEDVSLPVALFSNLSNTGVADIVALALRHGFLLGKSDERISIGVAAPAIAKLLDVVPELPVMVLDRVVYTRDGLPAEWRTGYCHLGNEYAYLAEMK
jgi:GntR family transcriptional regulator